MRKIHIRLTPRVIAFLVVLSLAASVFSVPRDSTVANVTEGTFMEVFTDDDADAGKLYQYTCKLPSGLGDGYSNKSRTGGRKSSVNRAITSAMWALMKSGWSVSGPDWVTGEWDLLKKGQVVYTVMPSCKQKSVAPV